MIPFAVSFFPAKLYLGRKDVDFKAGCVWSYGFIFCSCSTLNTISVAIENGPNCGMGAIGGAAGGAFIADKGYRGTGAIIGALLGGLCGFVMADKLGEKDKKEISTADKQH